MKLNVIERLWIFNNLPQKSNVANYLLLRDGKEKLGLSEKESELLNLRNEERDGKMVSIWDNEGAIAIGIKDVKLNDYCTETIKEILKQFDDNEEIDDFFYQLYKKFLG